jgi:hypothetical protein
VPSGPDLLREASAILAREAQRLSSTSSGAPSRVQTVVPSGVVPSGAGPSGIVPHGLVPSGAVPSGAGPSGVVPSGVVPHGVVPSGVVPSGVPGAEASGTDLARRVSPITAAASLTSATDRLRQQADDLLTALLNGFRGAPGGGFDQDRLRPRAYELIDTLLSTFSEAAGDSSPAAVDTVPLLQCDAPVQAGSEARAVLTVSNQEATPSDVTLYCTNFVADSGHEISALRVTFSPRIATIPAHGTATFHIKIAVSQQAAAGIYSALIQAMGSRFVKAVLSMEVL